LDSDRAEKYRLRAADCLEAAQTVTNLRIKENLLAVAQSWQRLAEQIERRTDPANAGGADYACRLTRFVWDAGPITPRTDDEETGPV
jgi:hypothetical protein